MNREYLPLGEFRKRRRDPRRRAIIQLVEEGFRVQELTEYQYRINDVLDYYPTNDKYHDLKRNVRGEVRDNRHSVGWHQGGRAQAFIRKFFLDLKGTNDDHAQSPTPDVAIAPGQDGMPLPLSRD